jgi:drug/metabolite transporter (DMT)-like permease
LIAGIGLTGVALIRLGRRFAGTATIAAALLTAGAFLATGGDEPGGMQRVGIVVATGWLASIALVTLAATLRRARRSR